MRRRILLCLALAVLCGLAFLLRALGFETVFVGGDEVVFQSWDSYYHARRALFSFEHFPRLLLFDPYLGHPHGAAVPFPPLYDFALAAAARLLADSKPGFEAVVAWSAPVIGALTLLPVFAAARVIASPGVALGAAALCALLPAAAVNTRVGNCDHHGAVALLGACLLALYLAALSPQAQGRRRFWLFAALVPVRAALLGVWQGSLFYFCIGEVAFVLTGALAGRRELLRAEAWSALTTAIVIAPLVAISLTPIGGPWSAVELSRLHVAFFVAAAAVSAGIAALEGWRPARGGGRRLLRGVAIGAALAALLLALPGPRAGLAPAFGFVMKTDDYSGRNLEQRPLFGEGGSLLAGPGPALFGGFAWLLGLAPLAALARARERSRREPALLLAAWTAIFGFLSVRQTRYVTDFAPAAALALSLLLSQLAALLPDRLPRGTRGAAACGLAVLLLIPAFQRGHGPAARSSWAQLRDPAPARDRALLSFEGSALRFAQRVREATPATRGYRDADARPEYGIMAFPGIGHVLHYVAERATPTDNFGVYIGAESYFDTEKFFRLQDEAEALAHSERYDTPYVATTDYGGEATPALVYRLHRDDGRARGALPRWERFRLVTEGPAGGRPVGLLFQRGLPAYSVPYKLFERVAGATIEAAAQPGTRVTAQTTVETPLGRRFRYRAEVRADAEGVARLRVPYATQTELPTRPLGPWRVRVGERAFALDTSDADVREGAVLRLPEAAR